MGLHAFTQSSDSIMGWHRSIAHYEHWDVLVMHDRGGGLEADVEGLSGGGRGLLRACMLPPSEERAVRAAAWGAAEGVQSCMIPSQTGELTGYPELCLPPYLCQQARRSYPTDAQGLAVRRWVGSRSVDHFFAQYTPTYLCIHLLPILVLRLQAWAPSSARPTTGG